MKRSPNAPTDGSVDRRVPVYLMAGLDHEGPETGRGPRLNPPRLTQERFIAYLRNPPNPRQMPPYQQADVSDQTLADIYAFIRSLPSGSPDAETIPLLNDLLEEIPR